MSRVLVTGASGVVGQRCMAALAGGGHEVHGLAGPSHRDGVDLLDGGAARDTVAAMAPEVLVHLAWVTAHGRFWAAPENDSWVEASVSLVQRALDTGTRRIVVAGTGAEYDWRRTAADGRCVEDETPIDPSTPYGAAKARLHGALRELCAGRATVGWGRIFWLYGPPEPPTRLIPAVARALVAREPIALSSGVLERDYVHAADVGAALAALVDSDLDAAVNIGTGVGTSIRAVARRLAKLTGGADLLRFGERPEPDEPRRVVADVSRLTSAVGFTSAIDLDTGLREVVEWWRSREFA